MKRNTLMMLLTAALIYALLLTALSGCGKKDDASQPAEPTESAEPAEPTEAAPAVERQDGERYEGTVSIEGMEETVQYEHLRNADAGFEMAYDYERFERTSAGNIERFVSVYDDAANPENYLEVTYNVNDAETVAAAVSEVLSKDYEIIREPFTLDGAGECIRIDASANVGGKTMPDYLQMVYIIPAADGCRVATEHYYAVGSEGFGVRFRAMMNTLSVLDIPEGNPISNEQALNAVKRYCLAGNPDLADIVRSGEYPVSWEMEFGDDPNIVVLFRSYTGAELRYYIDPASGDTYVTEYVSGVMTEEQRTDESFNAWDYVF